MDWRLTLSALQALVSFLPGKSFVSSIPGYNVFQCPAGH
jgi:hypothetical protein